MIKVRVSQVFTRGVDDAVAAKKELDEGVPFDRVVETYSQCPSKSSSGDLGWMPQENMSGVFGVEFSSEDKGKIIGPIHSQYGYHILILTDIQEETLGFVSFQADTPMLAVQHSLPEVHTLLFEKFKIGMPVFGYGPEESLETISQSQNKSLSEILEFLNQEHHKRSLGGIGSDELRAKLDRKENLVLLDVRERWEHDIANIPEAVLITPSNSEQTLDSLSPADEIVVIDWKGERGGSFQRWLSQRGFTNVKCLQGGIDLWAAEIDTKMSRYDIDEDDDYRYEDIAPGEDDN